MKKEDILKNIENSILPENNIPGHNSMGASENYYNAYYLIGKCFDKDILSCMDENSLTHLVKLAEFAGEVFY